MIFLLLATILPFGSSIVLTYFQTIHHVNKESVAYNTELMKKGKEELGTYLEDIALMSTVLYRYTPFMNVLTQEWERITRRIWKRYVECWHMCTILVQK
ncbi:hypothetical protein AAHB53_11060 [Niallia circulans]